MRVWRIAREVYPLLDGEGARRWGGRWNSPGTPIVYTASSSALAVLESLVARDEEDAPEDLILASIRVPDDAPIERVEVTALPETTGRRRSTTVAARSGTRGRHPRDRSSSPSPPPSSRRRPTTC